jgi:hypothetical protein
LNGYSALNDLRPVRGSVCCVVNLLYPNNVKLLVRTALRALRSVTAFGVWSAEDLREFRLWHTFQVFDPIYRLADFISKLLTIPPVPFPPLRQIPIKYKIMDEAGAVDMQLVSNGTLLHMDVRRGQGKQQGNAQLAKEQKRRTGMRRRANEQLSETTCTQMRTALSAGRFAVDPIYVPISIMRCTVFAFFPTPTAGLSPLSTVELLITHTGRWTLQAMGYKRL